MDEESIKAVQLLIRNGLKEKLAEKTGFDAHSISIIFCGRNLNETTTIRSLFLGPQTNLTVILTKKKSSPGTIFEATSQIPNQSVIDDSSFKEHSSFHVFCKKEGLLQKGKLRAYSTCWDDLLISNRIKADCKGCDCMATPVRFSFKCIEYATPLSHIKRNTKRCECVICGDFGQLCVSLDCAHNTCIDCFTAYCQQVHDQSNMVYKKSVGFTVPCAVSGCFGCVTDVHIFYILGVNAYKRYQRLAAQMYFAQQDSKQYCPSRLCGAAFMLEDEEDDTQEKIIMCPECSKCFCRFCRAIVDCVCEQKVSNQE
uniref:RBR-type E3 ubiquitin transferase n=1 Tax=Ditylenchus dipsaci TaxID=166011 RepID=A0A915D427_9BILA